MWADFKPMISITFLLKFNKNVVTNNYNFYYNYLLKKAQSTHATIKHE